MKYSKADIISWVKKYVAGRERFYLSMGVPFDEVRFLHDLHWGQTDVWELFRDMEKDLGIEVSIKVDNYDRFFPREPGPAIPLTPFFRKRFLLKLEKDYPPFTVVELMQFVTL